MHRLLRGADVCLIPNSLDAFSRVKSANRAVLSLSLGTPVVATSIPSFEPLADSVVFDDFASGIDLYLRDAARRDRDLTRAREVLSREFGLGRIRQLWLALLESLRVPNRTESR
jgi:glycosyltransferase involved in cell wall biosynthesis